jgi:pimeloyl-ACP methyl ester carboxylesterase
MQNLKLFGCALLVSFVFAQASPRLIRLPRPSGKYGVARISYDWIDRSRLEAYARDAATRREIMVYVWYPIERGLRSGTLCEYLPHARLIAQSLKDVPRDEIEDSWGRSWASIFSDRIVTDTYEGAQVPTGIERFPLLIFSPGFTAPSTSYTTLIEEVVSQGYVVASIEPTYDVAAVAFPDGRVIPFKAQWQPGAEPPPPGETWQQFLSRIRTFDQTHAEAWAADIRFVIDQMGSLENRSIEAPEAPFARRIDLRNIGVWGHSVGGRAAARACLLDSRIKACLDADGGAAEGGNLPSQPFMWIDVYHEPATDVQLAAHGIGRIEWEKYHQARVKDTQQRLDTCPSECYRLIIKIPGADHYTFSDGPLLDAPKKTDFDAAIRALRPIEAYTVAFFNKHLKHQGDFLVDQTTKSARGITLEKYGQRR